MNGYRDFYWDNSLLAKVGRTARRALSSGHDIPKFSEAEAIPTKELSQTIVNEYIQGCRFVQAIGKHYGLVPFCVAAGSVYKKAVVTFGKNFSNVTKL